LSGEGRWDIIMKSSKERSGVVTAKGKPLTLMGATPSVGEQAPDFDVLDKNSHWVSLADYRGRIKIISVTPSLDTPVCDVQARRFNSEAAVLPADVVILNVSMDLPFALDRFCSTADIDRVITLSDHRDASFGEAYGVLIKELRLLARSIFIIDKEDHVRYVEIVPELTNHPDYEKALASLRTVVDMARAA
jgi:thiol peroxidase